MFAFVANGQVKEPNSAEKGKMTEGGEATNQIFLAYQAAKYGRLNKSPDALIFAASILKTTFNDKVLVEKETEGGQPDSGTKNSKSNLNADTFLKEAKLLAKGDKNLLGRIAAVAKMEPKERGAIGGPKRGTTEVKSYGTDVVNLRFKGGENAVITVTGDGDTDLDLFVYDESGNLVGSDTGGSDDCRVRFFPKWSGVFKIKIKNLGNVYNHYTLVTN